MLLLKIRYFDNWIKIAFYVLVLLKNAFGFLRLTSVTIFIPDSRVATTSSIFVPCFEGDECCSFISHWSMVARILQFQNVVSFWNGKKWGEKVYNQICIVQNDKQSHHHSFRWCSSLTSLKTLLYMNWFCRYWHLYGTKIFDEGRHLPMGVLPLKKMAHKCGCFV